MSAKLVVISGESAGAEVWIEEEVLRLGRDAKCEVCLPDADVASHAATLEFREGEYLVHNRGDRPLRLAGRVVALRGSQKWPAGKELQLTDVVTLRLDVQGDPAPARRPAPARVKEAEEAPPEDVVAPDRAADEKAAAAKKSKNTVQLAIIAAAIVVGAVFLFADDLTTPDTPPRDTAADFRSLVNDLGKERPKEKGPDSLVFMLQSARLHQLRGERKQAKALYGHLRDELARRRKPDYKFPDKLDERLWDFVDAQLKALEEPAAETSG